MGDVIIMVDEIICKLGLYDIPMLQKQLNFSVDLLKSNIALFASTQSGKTNMIRLIINILHKKMTVDTEQIFILDFGGALLEYQNMPLVSAYFDNSNEEYVKRVFKILEGKLKDNTSVLGNVSFSQKKDGNQPKHITFFIDNFNAFLDEPRYSGYHEKFARLCRDGLSKGISIVITASDTKGTYSYLNSFSQKIALSLTEEKYSELFGRKVTSIGNIPGRGFANITLKFPDVNRTYDVNAPYEIHCSYAEPLSTLEFQKGLYAKYGTPNGTGSFPKQVVKYKLFPKTFNEKAYYSLLGKKTDDTEVDKYKVSVGLDYVNFQPVICNFEQSRFLAIYSKRDFCREDLVDRLVNKLMKTEGRKLVLFDDGRGGLNNIHMKYPSAKYISKYDVINVRTWLEADCKQPSTEIHTLNHSSAASSFMGISSAKTPVHDKTFESSGFQIKSKKVSPMQQFLHYIHEECMDIGNFAGPLYTGKEIVYRERSKMIPIGCEDSNPDPTLFIIQSKLTYSTVQENKVLLEYILPMLSDIAEDRDYIFLFTDVKKIADNDMNDKFNSIIRSIFVLDNIAEFVSERGQKTLLGDMDVKTLKADYAKCEKGDAYYYDVEADDLVKLKLIQKE